MWTCPRCGANVDEGVSRCWGCGWEPVAAAGGAGGATSQAAPGAGPEPPARDRLDAPGWWDCSRCGTRVEPGFQVCWNCGTSIDGVEDPDFVAEDEAAVSEEDPGVPLILGREPAGELGRGEQGAGSVAALACPRCAGAMREGFLAPVNPAPLNKNALPVRWNSGAPQWSFMWGYQPGDESHPVQAYRCEHCGYLEFYARGE